MFLTHVWESSGTTGTPGHQAWNQSDAASQISFANWDTASQPGTGKVSPIAMTLFSLSVLVFRVQPIARKQRAMRFLSL